MAKKEAVKEIFNDIAPKYDLLNHFLSLNIDKRWRRKAIGYIRPEEKGELLDVACGTGDFSIAAYRAGVQKVTGIDISANMVAIGQKKVDNLGLTPHITLQAGDSEQIEFEDEHFDVVTVAFGVRNFEHLEAGLREIEVASSLKLENEAFDAFLRALDEPVPAEMAELMQREPQWA